MTEMTRKGFPTKVAALEWAETWAAQNPDKTYYCEGFDFEGNYIIAYWE